MPEAKVMGPRAASAFYGAWIWLVLAIATPVEAAKLADTVDDGELSRRILEADLESGWLIAVFLGAARDTTSA